jgi:hypothetical protein
MLGVRFREVRTLVASKARLATLTYVEETQGWVIPQDADDRQQPGAGR